MAIPIVGAQPGHGETPVDEPALICAEDALKERFHYWRGASGKRYLHSVYSLVECPQIPRANYILVTHRADGSRLALRIGRTMAQANSLNLAFLRHQAAKLGANEVHIHVLADSRAERKLAETDLRAGLFAELAPQKTQ